MLQMKDRSEFSDRIFPWKNCTVFHSEEATKTFLYEADHSSGAVWCMKPGQKLPIHCHKEAFDIWVVLHGQADYFPNETDQVLIKAGDVVLAHPGQWHGMINNYSENFIMLGFAGPNPIGFIPGEHKYSS